MNLARFFKFTGAALIVIASGVLAYGVHDLQEAGILPGLDNLAWNISGWEVTSWYGTIIKGVFNVGPQMTVLEVVVYFAYLVPTMYLFLRPVRRAPAPAGAPEAGADAVPSSATALVRDALTVDGSSPTSPTRRSLHVRAHPAAARRGVHRRRTRRDRRLLLQ